GEQRAPGNLAPVRIPRRSGRRWPARGARWVAGRVRRRRRYVLLQLRRVRARAPAAARERASPGAASADPRRPLVHVLRAVAVDLHLRVVPRAARWIRTAHRRTADLRA